MDQQAKLSPRCRAATNRQSNRYQGPGSIRPRTHEPMLSRASDAGKMPNKHMMAQLQGREGMQGPDMCCVGFAKLAVLAGWRGGREDEQRQAAVWEVVTRGRGSRILPGGRSL